MSHSLTPRALNFYWRWVTQYFHQKRETKTSSNTLVDRFIHVSYAEQITIISNPSALVYIQSAVHANTTLHFALVKLFDHMLHRVTLHGWTSFTAVWSLWPTSWLDTTFVQVINDYLAAEDTKHFPAAGALEYLRQAQDRSSFEICRSRFQAHGLNVLDHLIEQWFTAGYCQYSMSEICTLADVLYAPGTCFLRICIHLTKNESRALHQLCLNYAISPYIDRSSNVHTLGEFVRPFVAGLREGYSLYANHFNRLERTYVASVCGWYGVYPMSTDVDTQKTMAWMTICAILLQHNMVPDVLLQQPYFAAWRVWIVRLPEYGITNYAWLTFERCHALLPKT